MESQPSFSNPSQSCIHQKSTLTYHIIMLVFLPNRSPFNTFRFISFQFSNPSCLQCIYLSSNQLILFRQSNFGSMYCGSRDLSIIFPSTVPHLICKVVFQHFPKNVSSGQKSSCRFVVVTVHRLQIRHQSQFYFFNVIALHALIFDHICLVEVPCREKLMGI